MLAIEADPDGSLERADFIVAVGYLIGVGGLRLIPLDIWRRASWLR
jgi:hypothetical protein